MKYTVFRMKYTVFRMKYTVFRMKFMQSKQKRLCACVKIGMSSVYIFINFQSSQKSGTELPQLFEQSSATFLKASFL